MSNVGARMYVVTYVFEGAYMPAPMCHARRRVTVLAYDVDDAARQVEIALSEPGEHGTRDCPWKVRAVLVEPFIERMILVTGLQDEKPPRVLANEVYYPQHAAEAKDL